MTSYVLYRGGFFPSSQNEAMMISAITSHKSPVWSVMLWLPYGTLVDEFLLSWRCLEWVQFSLKLLMMFVHHVRSVALWLCENNLPSGLHSQIMVDCLRRSPFLPWCQLLRVGLFCGKRILYARTLCLAFYFLHAWGFAPCILFRGCSKSAWTIKGAIPPCRTTLKVYLDSRGRVNVALYPYKRCTSKHQ